MVDDKLVPEGNRFKIQNQTISERLSTINTTDNYKRSFQFLREGVKELADGLIIPPILMLKNEFIILNSPWFDICLIARKSNTLVFYDENEEVN